ncbi:spermatogenesis-associated protein 48-like [Physella acuta]|uniref:spermatogenesis-associated protein 48-like n=1 Tax=Physella acuta TaxID=109671 RepID=UPI0027DD49C6|nr:spermatogenesis-associated protein 48-like [Physella acuta]
MSETMYNIVPHQTTVDNNEFVKFSNFVYPYMDLRARDQALENIEQNRRLRKMKFPSLRGRHDVDSFQEDIRTNNNFTKWNENGEFRATAPCRSYDNAIDPTSGFVSAGYDVTDNTGHFNIQSMVQNNKSPQSLTPCRISTIRNEPAAPPELKHENMRTQTAPIPWNSRKTLDVCIRSKLGGWTSDVDPRKTHNTKQRPKTSPAAEQSRIERDKLALKYIYGTSTQRAYEEVPWDLILPPRIRPPVSTMEDKPDNVSHRWGDKRYAATAQEWQAVGPSLDRFLPRKGHYKDGPIKFCSPCSRVQQIPLYSGCIGAENLDEVDNEKEKFEPYTVKRNPQPKPTDTSHRPNIPLYDGCTLWQGSYAPAHQTRAVQFETSTSSVHRSFPTESPAALHKKGADFAKMVTLVSPGNPYNSVMKEQIQV